MVPRCKRQFGCVAKLFEIRFRGSIKIDRKLTRGNFSSKIRSVPRAPARDKRHFAYDETREIAPLAPGKALRYLIAREHRATTLKRQLRYDPPLRSRSEFVLDVGRAARENSAESSLRLSRPLRRSRTAKCGARVIRDARAYTRTRGATVGIGDCLLLR